MEATPAEQVAEAQGLDEAEAFALYCENEHANTIEACEALVEAFADDYIAEMTALEYAEQTITDNFFIPTGLEGYIDYEAYARDLQMGGDIYELGSHLFRG
jgi:antirestriction protein